MTLINSNIKNVSAYFPERVLSNEEICEHAAHWTPEKILLKTGISERRISEEGQTSLDLAEGAALKLFDESGFSPDSFDYLILCTQTPDHFLPTGACILQNRLNMKQSIGAIDVNQGCSGYIYSLSLAKALIASGQAKNILLLTADTYTKLINKRDFSVRTLFGDGATASHITECGEGVGIGEFIFGTDGSGADRLIVPSGAFRSPTLESKKVETEDAFGNFRRDDQLYMDGGAVLLFGLSKVPKLMNELLAKEGLVLDNIDYFVFHQASALMLDKLIKKIGIPKEKMLIEMLNYGNTVSSTIPIVLHKYMNDGTISKNKTVAMVGFGVGLSWAGCIFKT